MYRESQKLEDLKANFLFKEELSAEEVKSLARQWQEEYGPQALERCIQACHRWARQSLAENRQRSEYLERIVPLYFLLYQTVLLSRHASSREEFLQGLARLLFQSPGIRAILIKLEDQTLAYPEEASSLAYRFPSRYLNDPEWTCQARILSPGELPEPFPLQSGPLGVAKWILLPLMLRGWVSGILLVGTSQKVFSDWERVLLLEDLPEQINASLEIIQEKKLEEGPLFDPLTGLPLEGYFLVLTEQRLREARSRGQRLLMLAIGVDRMVHVNQAFGFRTGDELLRILAERLKNFADSSGEMARGRSETFYLLVPEPPDLSDYLERLKGALSGPVDLGRFLLEVTLSIGVARFPQDAPSPGALLRRARTALHEAKRLGGNRVAFFSEDLHRRARTFLTLLPRLRKALRHKEFVVFCQPRLDLREGRICGGEILVRWQDPERGLIPPGEFIWVLEESGLISELGLWVAEETCRILLDLPREMFVALNLSFNVSPRQLWGANFVPRFLDILRRYRLCPTRIKIEITESIFIEHTEEITEELRKIARAGVKVVLDDFGTGYSSLHYLSRLPVHDIKIDQSFVQGLPHSESHLEIVKAIIALARALGKRVVAEGVETVEQLRCLQRLGVDEVQGFLFSPPVPWERFRQWLDVFPEEWKTYLQASSREVEDQGNLC